MTTPETSVSNHLSVYINVWGLGTYLEMSFEQLTQSLFIVVCYTHEEFVLVSAQVYDM